MIIKEPEIEYKDRLDYLSHKVENLDDYLAFNSGVFTFDNPMFNRCLNKLKEIVGNKNIGILPDPDADGYTSTAILNGVYMFHKVFHRKEKVHGLDIFIVDKIIESGIEYILLPDSSTNDLDMCKLLNSKGVTTIILDHHQTDIQSDIEEYELESDKYFIINNQFGGLNKNLTGAGVCFLAMAKVTEGGINRLSHLVSIGQVGDSSDISDLQIRRLVYGGMQNGNKLLEQFEIDSSSDLSYSIIPIINAVLRVGEIKDKIILLDVLTGVYDDGSEVIEKRKRDRRTGKMPLVKMEMPSIKVKLDELAKLKVEQRKFVSDMADNIDSDLILNDKVGIALVDHIEYRSTTGLVATRMVEKYDKPFMYLVKDGEYYSGSARSESKYIGDFREWCQSMDSVDLAQGHPNAFGFRVHKDNIDKFISDTRGLKRTDSDIEVDFLYGGYVDRWLIDDLANNQDNFGGKVANPTIGIEILEVEKKYVKQMGKVLTFYHSGVEFIWYQAPLDFIDQVEFGFSDTIDFNIVGKVMVNEWRGTRRGRFTIDLMEVNETFVGGMLI